MNNLFFLNLFNITILIQHNKLKILGAMVHAKQLFMKLSKRTKRVHLDLEYSFTKGEHIF